MSPTLPSCYTLPAVCLRFRLGMCAKYRSVKGNPRLLFHFGVEFPSTPPQGDLYPLSLAPFIRNARRSDVKECVAAGFGLIPSWSKDKKSARHYYNARTDTVATKPSFWRCLAQGALRHHSV